LFVIDDSGSTASTDPNGHRYTAARRILNLLTEGIGGPKLDDRIGVVHFADYPRPCLPLTPIKTKPPRVLIRQALRQLTGGGTAIVPPLQLVSRMLARGNEAKAVVLFTDGESAESAAQLADVVSGLPIGSLHVVALGEELPAQWLDVPVASVTALTSLETPDEVEWVMARALYRSLSLTWPPGPGRPPNASRNTPSSLDMSAGPQRRDN
jgi:hypothetical protein